jgi:hypothetical protein
VGILILYYLSSPTQIPRGPRAVLERGELSRHASAAFIRVGPWGVFIHISITTPVVSALKNYYIQKFLEVPADILNHFWIQVAVSN